MNYYALLEEYNSGIVAWGKSRSKDFRTEFKRLGIRIGAHTNTVRSGFGKNRDGEIYRVSFHMSRVMVFVHKGVGRGYPANKAGDGSAFGRKAKPWFNPVVEKNFDSLADHVADAKADILMNNIMIK